jgi:hypothetical protein
MWPMVVGSGGASFAGVAHPLQPYRKGWVAFAFVVAVALLFVMADLLQPP